MQWSCTLNSVHHHIKTPSVTDASEQWLPSQNMSKTPWNFLSHIYSCRMFPINQTRVGQAESPGHILPWQLLMLAELRGIKSWQRRIKQKVLQMFQCQNTLILVSTSLTYFTKKSQISKEQPNPVWALGVKSPNKSDFCSTQFLQQLRVHDLIRESEFRHLQDANSQSIRWPRQFLAQLFTEMPKIRLLQEIKKRGSTWSFPRDIHKLWWWFLFVTTQQRLQISWSGVSPTSLPFLLSKDATHSSAALVHVVLLTL